MTDNVISLKNASYIYNIGSPVAKKALSNINLQIPRGAFVGIVGAPGSGKTTLAMLMAGLICPTSGEALTAGIGPHKNGLVFQSPEKQLFGATVFEDITFAMRQNAENSQSEIEKAFENACKKVDLNPLALRNRRPLQLSSGEKRRVAIAGVLVMNPDILIFDEPTVGLDYHASQMVIAEIDQLSKEGKTIIIISHDIEECLQGADMIYVFDAGKIVDKGSLKEILMNMALKDDKRPELPQITRFLNELKEKGLSVNVGEHNPEKVFVDIKKALKSLMR